MACVEYLRSCRTQARTLRVLRGTSSLSRLEAGAPSAIVVVHTRYASLYHPEVRYAL